MNARQTAMPDTLTRDNLRDHVVRELSDGSATRAEILLVEVNGVRAAVKDYRSRDRRYRATIGRWLISREAAMYGYLNGVPGIPAFYHHIDRYALAVEYIEGKNCSQCAPGELGPEFFDALREIVAALHARGVAHCDLKKDTNIIVDDHGRPHVIDLAAALRRHGGPLPMRPLMRWLWPRFAKDDIKAISKLKRKLAPELLTAEQRRALEHRTRAERLLKLIMRTARRIIKLLATKGEDARKARA